MTTSTNTDDFSGEVVGTAPAPDQPARRDRLIAVLLAAVIPGAGHLYLRRLVPVLPWLVLSAAFYYSSLRWGILVHGLCLLHTAFTRRR